MSRDNYINPLNDFFIRYLFAAEGNEEICRNFINAVLVDAGFPPVEKITIKNPFNLKAELGAKESITDIKAESNAGKSFDIEVQCSDKGSLIKRSLYYGTKMYCSRLAEGADYQSLKPVVVINLLDFVLWPKVEKLHSCFMLLDKDDGRSVMSEDLIYHFIEAPKLTKYPEKLSKILKQWLDYFGKEGKLEEAKMSKLLKNNLVLQKAHNHYKRFISDAKYREAYETKLKWQSDRVSEINYAERRGMEKGMEKGMEEGEYRKALATANKMRGKGFSAEEIADLTDLSLTVIEKLLANKYCG